MPHTEGTGRNTGRWPKGSKPGCTGVKNRGGNTKTEKQEKATNVSVLALLEEMKGLPVVRVGLVERVAEKIVGGEYGPAEFAVALDKMMVVEFGTRFCPFRKACPFGSGCPGAFRHYVLA